MLILTDNPQRKNTLKYFYVEFQNRQYSTNIPLIFGCKNALWSQKKLLISRVLIANNTSVFNGSKPYHSRLTHARLDSRTGYVLYCSMP